MLYTPNLVKQEQHKNMKMAKYQENIFHLLLEHILQVTQNI